MLARHSKKIEATLYLIILGLVVAVGYSLHGQTRSSVEDEVIEAGLIESGGQPALYFNLRNTGVDYAGYTYIVRYDSTGEEFSGDSSTITVEPSQTFRYSISLLQPRKGTMHLNLKIYRGNAGVGEVLLHDQTWFVGGSEASKQG